MTKEDLVIFKTEEQNTWKLPTKDQPYPPATREWKEYIVWVKDPYGRTDIPLVCSAGVAKQLAEESHYEVLAWTEAPEMPRFLKEK